MRAAAIEQLEVWGERTGVPAVALPFSVGGDAQSKDLFGLFDSTIAKLLGAAK